MLKGRHLIEPGDLTLEELEEILSLADKIIVDPQSFYGVCRGKLLATLFFEPSTRTRLSFEAAMLRLGGKVLGFSDANATSTTKGESLADTIRTVSSYTDVIAMRNPKEGAALLASKYSLVPIINAGDGGHHHPTQTLTDLLTIRASKGGFEGHTIGFCGDLKFGRTVHSLAKALSRYKNNKFILISPPELGIPDYMISEVFEKNNIPYTINERLENVIGDLDILYMTRVQKERFFNEQDYEIAASGTTGSARKLVGSMIGAQVVKNEITAHAENGVAVDYAMNTLCAAGTGAFLSSQAHRLGVEVEDFGRIALSAKRAAPVAARCTVFAESDLVHKLQVGYPKEEIIAGLCKAVAGNYLNNVAKGKKIVSPVVFQGGVSKNQGVVKMFEEELGMPVLVDEKGHLMGAFGIAVLAKEQSIPNRMFLRYRLETLRTILMIEHISEKHLN